MSVTRYTHSLYRICQLDYKVCTNLVKQILALYTSIIKVSYNSYISQWSSLKHVVGSITSTSTSTAWEARARVVLGSENHTFGLLSALHVSLTSGVLTALSSQAYSNALVPLCVCSEWKNLCLILTDVSLSFGISLERSFYLATENSNRQSLYWNLYFKESSIARSSLSAIIPVWSSSILRDGDVVSGLQSIHFHSPNEPQNFYFELFQKMIQSCRYCGGIPCMPGHSERLIDELWTCEEEEENTSLRLLFLISIISHICSVIYQSTHN